MAEVDLVSSHTPWTPLPKLVPWSQLGDGRVFASQPEEGESAVAVWGDPERVRQLYADSVAYTLEATFSYLATFDQSDLVLIVVGDHQPSRIVSGDDAIDQRARLPKDVEAYQISGPLFFGTANRLDNLLDQFPKPPRAFILRMRLVPVIDASGVHALQKLADRCHRKGIALIVSGLQEQPNRVLARMQTREHPGELHLAPDFEHALRLAERLVRRDASNPDP